MTDEVRITRLLAAPRELVFAAWIDPRQVASWWAPPGFEVPPATVEIDARVGGRIHFAMVALGGGAQYAVRFEILELSEPELLVLRSEAMPAVGLALPTITRVVLGEEGDRTRLTVTQGPHTEAMLPQALAGWAGCLDNLAALVAA